MVEILLDEKRDAHEKILVQKNYWAFWKITKTKKFATVTSAKTLKFSKLHEFNLWVLNVLRNK